MEKEASHEKYSDLTTQAQRPGAQEATIATSTLPPGSLQRMVRPLGHGFVLNLSKTRLNSSTDISCRMPGSPVIA